MFTYRGPADCALADGTSMLVSVRLTPEPGLLDGLVGTATSRTNFPVSYLNAEEVMVRLPDGRSRKFVVVDKQLTRLELVSNDEWLT